MEFDSKRTSIFLLQTLMQSRFAGVDMKGKQMMPPKMSAKQQSKVGKVMHEFKAGKLKSSSGQKVTNPKQGIAIALSEARSMKKK